MLKTKVIDYNSKQQYEISYFADDTIETIRNRIGIQMDIHPDRLFILVALETKLNYYEKDIRRWESLFMRISGNGSQITKEILDIFARDYSIPEHNIDFHPYDRFEWLDLYPKKVVGSEKLEYRIFGVQEEKSYILPFQMNIPLKIPSAAYPVPELNTLLNSLYEPYLIKNFLVFQKPPSITDALLPIYFPFYRSITPIKLSPDYIQLLNKNTDLLNKLINLDIEVPKNVAIIKTTFYIPLVETDFGSLVKTRFEQIFYGLTVSTDTPYIGYFTSKEQISRHKFYVKNPADKKPLLDMTDWNYWYTTTKPMRNRPTLLFYRGKSKYEFDRIAITDLDIVANTRRVETNKETVDEMKQSLIKWLLSFDAVVPFMEERDLQKSRWKLQETSAFIKYKTKITEFDLKRLNCVSSIYNYEDNVFHFLRSDHQNGGLSVLDIKVLQMIKSGYTIDKIHTELGITFEQARKLYREIEEKIEDEPFLVEKIFKGFPVMKLTADTILFTSISKTSDIQYANILRHILNPESNLDDICPKSADSFKSASTIIQSEDVDDSDFFSFLEDKVEEPEVAEPEQKEFVDVKKTDYGYFKNRLEKFIPAVGEKGSNYAKICEKKHQPIILDESDLQRLKDGQYNPETYLDETEMLKVSDPTGLVICPAYWCMRDQIPLQESQLVNNKCPVCGGKIQTKASDSPIKFSVVKRESVFKYPALMAKQQNLPCCFKTTRQKKEIASSEGKYYIIGETKLRVPQFRLAFIPGLILKSLYIPETYSSYKTSNRIDASSSGYFRVGMLPSDLPLFLDLPASVPNSVETILKCSFLRNWNKPTDTHLESLSEYPAELGKIISGIMDARKEKTLLPIEELEYTALALQCDIFRIMWETGEYSCLFSGMTRPRTRAVIILQSNAGEFNILAHCSKKGQNMVYRSNVYSEPFKKDTYAELEKLRNTTCHTKVPTYDNTLNILKKLLVESEADDYTIIVDPYERGQAFFVPKKFIIPFESTNLPTVDQQKIYYSSIKKEDYPTLASELLFLKTAGIKVGERILNGSGEIVELMLEYGLRVPVVPEATSVPQETHEITQTVLSTGEDKLLWEQPNKKLKENYTEISYESEVYEFLLFQLSTTLSDYPKLKESLVDILPSKKQVQTELKKWFTGIVKFIEEKPANFITKIRKPCGQFLNKCSGNLCGFDGDVCKVNISKKINSEKLFTRLLKTLLENSKIRSIVLDGRMTPFFSTILYLDLPHELIVTDLQLPN